MAIEKKVAFLGGGNMAEALIKGLIISGGIVGVFGVDIRFEDLVRAE